MPKQTPYLCNAAVDKFIQFSQNICYIQNKFGWYCTEYCKNIKKILTIYTLEYVYELFCKIKTIS